jgi:hypothetical protein
MSELVLLENLFTPPAFPLAVLGVILTFTDYIRLYPPLIEVIYESSLDVPCSLSSIIEDKRLYLPLVSFMLALFLF